MLIDYRNILWSPVMDTPLRAEIQAPFWTLILGQNAALCCGFLNCRLRKSKFGCSLPRRSPLGGGSTDALPNTRMAPANPARPSFHPLPQGRGRGEGERNTRKPKRFQIWLRQTQFAFHLSKGNGAFFAFQPLGFAKLQQVLCVGQSLLHDQKLSQKFRDDTEPLCY